MAFFSRVSAVSYTHLDVYKRQLERGQAFRSFVQFSRKHDIHLSDVQVQKVKVDGEQELNVILNAHCASRTSCGNLVEILREAPGVNYICLLYTSRCV